MTTFTLHGDQTAEALQFPKKRHRDPDRRPARG